MTVKVSHEGKGSGDKDAARAVIALFNGKVGGCVMLDNITKTEDVMKEFFEKHLIDDALWTRYGLKQEEDFLIKGKAQAQMMEVIVKPTHKNPVHINTHAHRKLNKSTEKVTKSTELCEIAQNSDVVGLERDLPLNFHHDDLLGFENINHEFKQYKETERNGERLTREKLIKNILDDVPEYVSAFANTLGGYLMIGVDGKGQGQGAVSGQDYQLLVIGSDGLGFQEFIRKLRGKIEAMRWFQHGEKIHPIQGNHWEVSFEKVFPPRKLLEQSASRGKTKLGDKGSTDQQSHTRDVQKENATPKENPGNPSRNTKEGQTTAGTSTQVQKGSGSNTKSSERVSNEKVAVYSTTVVDVNMPTSTSAACSSIEHSSNDESNQQSSGNTSHVNNNVASKTRPSGAPRKKRKLSKQVNSEEQNPIVDEKVVIVIRIPRLSDGIVFTQHPECPIYSRSEGVINQSKADWQKMWIPILYPHTDR